MTDTHRTPSSEEPILEVVVGTMPEGPNLFPEISLIKPALLYADRVRLFSPMANILADFVAASKLEGTDRATLMIQMAQAIGDEVGLEHMEAIRGAMAVASLPREQRRRILGGKRSKELRDLMQELDSGWDRLQQQLGEQLEAAGAPELEVALASGIVDVEPLINAATEEFDDIFINFLSRLGGVLEDSRAYPLFDDRTGSLISAGIAEGLFTSRPEATVRGKEVGAAAQFLQYLPAFPGASISEVLDIRRELRSPLTRFRAAMNQLAQLIDSNPFGEDFIAEVERLYRAEVAPAIQEIKEEVEENRYLKRLLGAAVKDIPKWLGGGFIAFAFTPWSNIPELVVAGTTAVEPAVKAAWKKRQEGAKIRQRQHFLLYEVEHLLEN